RGRGQGQRCKGERTCHNKLSSVHLDSPFESASRKSNYLVLGSGDVCSETTLDWEEWREIRDEMRLNRRQKGRKGLCTKNRVEMEVFPLRPSAYLCVLCVN